MARASSYAVASVLCGFLVACGNSPSEQSDPSPTGGAGSDVAATGGQENPGSTGSGGMTGSGGAVASGGIATGSGGALASGGIVGEGGSIATGGMVGEGGQAATGGIPGHGGCTGAGGAGVGGSTTIPPIDLTCNTDDDCCVQSDTCRSVVVLYSKLQGLVYWPPATSTSCLRCFTPVVEVSCKNNLCSGTVVNANGTSGVPGVESHCGKIKGTGGATSLGTGGAMSLGTGGATSLDGGPTTQPRTAPVVSPPSLPIADELPPMFGCGI
jgi:hypothetical protein